MTVRIMRIHKRVMFDVLNSIKREKEINTKHDSFKWNHYETSHIAALLEKASLVKITRIRPITIKLQKRLEGKNNKNVWKYLKRKLPPNTNFETPAKHILNVVVGWRDDRVEYYSKGNSSKH